jgi:methionyl-tRNA synthetase
VHLLGKDILTTHAVYWPTMLMALGVALPKAIFAHGWWLTESGEKMSKSKGSVVKPLDMKSVVGVDPLRYFLTRDIALGNDAAFSPELVVTRVNSELANNLGNLLSRTTNLVEKNFGKSPGLPSALAPETKTLFGSLEKLAPTVKKAVLQMEPQAAVQAVVDVLNETNRYIGDRAPWKQVKEDLPAAGETLYACLEVLRVSAILLSPVMPEKCASILKSIGWEKEPDFSDAEKAHALEEGTVVKKAEPLFPRVEWRKD